MAEEANSVVNDSAVVEPAQTDSTPVENNSPSAEDADFDAGFNEDQPAPAETEEKVEDEAIVVDDDESQDETDSDETDAEDKPQSAAEKRKEQLEGEINEAKEKLGVDPNTEIRDLVSARNAIRQAVEQVNQQAYVPANEEELLEQVNPETGEYYNRLEAKFEAMKQEQQLRQYNEQVSENKLSLYSDVQRIQNDFPIFNEQSPEYNPQIAQQVYQIAEQSLIKDPRTGDVIGSNIPIYSIYKTVNDSYKLAAASGQAKQQRATESMLRNTDVSSSAAKEAAPKKDAFLAGFDSEI